MSHDSPYESPQTYRVVFQQGTESWEIQATSDDKVFELAKQCDAPVETLCHGIAACIRCKVKIVEGELSAPTPVERDRLGNIFHLTKERLACQSYVRSDVVLQIKEKKVRKKRVAQRRNSSKPISMMKNIK
jgi:ferredoxin, 2Fe-2S